MDFRKVVVALAALVLLAGLASAQPITCNATSASPTQIRAEGYTELVGDILLSCTSTAAATPGLIPVSQLANIQVFLTGIVTSRLLNGATSTPGQSEALLLIDEPSTAAGQVPCTTSFAGGAQGGCGTGNAPTISSTGTLTGANVYQGIVGTPNSQAVTFFGVPVIPPATAGGQRIYRITNIRVPGAGSSAFPTQIQAALSITGVTAVTVNQNTFNVALSQNGLATGLRNAGNSGSLTTPVGLPQCTSQGNDSTSTGNRTSNGMFQFTENFGSAFKTRWQGSSQTTVGTQPTAQNVPGQVNNNSESGFVPVAGSALDTAFSNGTFKAGLADSGTRLKAVFNNVPNGVRLYVSYTNMANATAGAATTAGSYAQLVATTAGGESIGDYNGLPPVTTSGDTIGSSTGTGAVTGGASAVELPVINGQAVAVWEVVNSLPFQLENFNFAFGVRYASSTATNSPAPGTFTVNLSFAPSANLAATNSASASAPIPRFQDTSTATRLITIAPCRTVLLFPYIANTGPFDTGIAISNTSTDPFGTTPQAGTCTLNAYGTNAPTQPLTTPSVASGSFTTVLASSQLPGFVGYVIATCNFQYAHGFAFISDLGTRNFAMGYLALVIPDPGTAGTGRPSVDFPNGGASHTTEILGQ